ncbi:hypothetical protein A1A1_18682, partial [Planococcus antarcticus DSM 14505]
MQLARQDFLSVAKDVAPASSSQASTGSPCSSRKVIERREFGQWLCDEASAAMQEHIFALRRLTLFLLS